MTIGVCMGGVSAFAASELRVAGSDFLGAEFSAALVSAAKRDGATVAVSLEGSRDGLRRLSVGEVDLALVVFAPDEKLPAAPLVVETWAYHVAVVVAPESFPVTQLSFDRLGGVFGAEGYAAIGEWRDLGVADNRARRPLFAYVLDGAGGRMASDVFAHTALRAPRLRATVRRLGTVSEIEERLAGGEGGLAVVPFSPVGVRGLRALAVARGEKDPAYGPTPENIRTGDYPLRWPVFLVFREESRARLAPVFRFLESEETGRFISESGLVGGVARSRK